jgi:hypothetical protein
MEEWKPSERKLFITIDFLYIIKIFQKWFRDYMRKKKKPQGKIIETASKKINDFRYAGNQMTERSNISMFLVGRMKNELEELQSRNKPKSLEVQRKYNEIFKISENAAITKKKEDSRIEEVMDDIDENMSPTFQENEILRVGKKLQTMTSIGIGIAGQNTPGFESSPKFLENFENLN